MQRRYPTGSRGEALWNSRREKIKKRSCGRGAEGDDAQTFGIRGPLCTIARSMAYVVMRALAARR